MAEKNEIEVNSVQLTETANSSSTSKNSNSKAVPRTTCGPNMQNDNRSVLTYRRSNSPQLNVIDDIISIEKDSFDRIVNENGEKSIEFGPNILPVAATKRIVKPETSSTENCSGMESHLLSKKSLLTKSVEKGDMVLKGKLSTGMKIKRPKPIHGTPEKSEIQRMFEKIRVKNENRGFTTPKKSDTSIKLDNYISPIHEILKPKYVRFSSPGKQSPKNTSISKLKKSEFDALRSIFEAGRSAKCMENEVRNINKNIDLKVRKDFSINASIKTSNNVIDSKATMGDNPTFQSDKISSKKTICSPIMVSRNVDKKLESKTVVCLPDQRNCSPKSDSKPKSTSKKLRNKMMNKSSDESSKVMSIKDFLERKKSKILQPVIDGESKPKKEVSN